MSCEFRILGPLEARCQGSLVPARGLRERVVLAVLLVDVGSVVPLGRFAEAIWEQDPPPAAAKVVRNSVSALRRGLARAGAGPVIETEPGGYWLRLADSSLDARLFEEQVAAAGRLGAGQASRAAAELRAALSLWRGPALAGIGGGIVEAAAARLEEQRLAALEKCLELELRLGAHQRLCAELQHLVRQWPLRERLTGQLMVALYRSGRQADALAAFGFLARRLRDELGIDPCGEVTRLHEAILRQDGGLDPDPRGRHSPRRCSGARPCRRRAHGRWLSHRWLAAPAVPARRGATPSRRQSVQGRLRRWAQTALAAECAGRLLIQAKARSTTQRRAVSHFAQRGACVADGVRDGANAVVVARLTARTGPDGGAWPGT